MWFPFAVDADVPDQVRADLDDVAASLRSASYLVRRALTTARFDVDGDGHPTDTAVAEAIKDATIAQLRFWVETGDETGAGAQNGGGSILSVTLPGGSGSTDPRTKQEARTAPAVAEILRGCEGIDWAVEY